MTAAQDNTAGPDTGDSPPVIRDRRKVDPITGKVRESSGTGQGPAGDGEPRLAGDGEPRPAGDGEPRPAGDGEPRLGGDGEPRLGGDGEPRLASDSEAADATPPAADATPSPVDVAASEVVAEAELIAARAELEERTDDLARVQADYANYRRRVERDRAQAGEFGRAEVLLALLPVLDDLDAAKAAGELDGPFAAVADKLMTTLAKFEMERFGQVGDPFDPTIHEALMHQTSEEATGPAVSLVIQPGYRAGERILRPARVGVVDAA